MSSNPPVFAPKTFSSGQTNPSIMKEYTVGDPNDFTPGEVSKFPSSGQQLSSADREELHRLRNERLNQSGKITEPAKKRIEILANIGRLTREVPLGGMSFTLRTLKTKETREATMSVFLCSNDIDAGFEFKKQVLARALSQIDGQLIEDVLGGDDLERKLAFIENDLEDVIVDKLYSEFNNLKQESRIKYGLETEKQAKEVVEDLKKS